MSIRIKRFAWRGTEFPKGVWRVTKKNENSGILPVSSVNLPQPLHSSVSTNALTWCLSTEVGMKQYRSWEVPVPLGTLSIDLVRRYPREFRVVGLAAATRMDLLAEQIKEFDPLVVAVPTRELRDDLYGRTGPVPVPKFWMAKAAFRRWPQWSGLIWSFQP